MTLYIIGLGLGDEKDITVKGLEAVKRCSKVFLEHYTSVLSSSVENLSKFYEKDIIIASRDMVEKDADNILEDAKDKDVAFLVVGDVFGATTHTDIFLRAKEKNIDVKVIHNASIINVVGATGLELYKFGKTTSIVFDDDGWLPDTPYKVIKMNKTNGLHTLCLLDIKTAETSKKDMLKGKDNPKDARFMTVKKACEILLKLEEKNKENLIDENLMVIGVARMGQETQKIIHASIKDFLESVYMGEPLHSLIIPGNLHFVEEEFLEQYEIKEKLKKEN
ncbi:diphthine synthase [Candidatus Woesearchaeota archaeon]|nr:MAG: diphthine synthase [Candidatus Woesearchaeota archaeon]